MRKLPFLLSFILTAVLFLNFANDASALTCSASVSPITAITGTENVTFTFTVINGDEELNWITLYSPHPDMQPGTATMTGWTSTVYIDTTELSGGTLAANATGTITVTPDIPSNAEGYSGNWIVEASSTGGQFSNNCSGTLGLSITEVPPAPTISSISVSEVNATSVKITWTTDESSTSKVIYGTTSGSYSFTKNNTSLVTSHSSTVSSNLAANTTYYYKVCSTNSGGYEGCSSENNFTTAAAGTATATPTATATATATATPTPTPTPTPFVDRVAPSVEITTDLTANFETAPLIEGEATDSIGVTSVEFSIDGGVNWLPVDDTEGLNSKSVTYKFTPQIFEDGNYEIQVRARDAEENTGTSDVVTVIIDRLPPRVGGNLLTLGPLALLPNEDGVIITIPGLEQRLTLSAVGGPTSLDLNVLEPGSTSGVTSSLGFNAQTGLWSGVLNMQNPGLYKIKTKAVDGAGNKTERDLNNVLVVEPGEVRNPSGKVERNGEVTVYVRNPLTRLWSAWNAGTFSQENPQKLIDGQYSYFLPPGTYYLTIEETGLPKLTSRIFTVEEARPLNSDFELFNRKTFKIGPIKIPLPDLFQDKAIVSFKENKVTADINPLIGRDIPIFNLAATDGEFNSASLRGERSIITFISTWSPPAIEQLPILDSYLKETSVSNAIIATQESLSRILVFQKRGNYSVPIIVDKDGELVEEFFINSLPTHFFVDRRGIIQNVVVGVLNKEELDSYLSAI